MILWPYSSLNLGTKVLHHTRHFLLKPFQLPNSDAVRHAACAAWLRPAVPVLVHAQKNHLPAFN